MTTILKRISFIFAVGLLLISIHWSQDGFNFSVAGNAGGTTSAIAIGYFIAAAMTVLQFVFSTNLRNLNASLIVFGLIAYIYSIGTNYQGILHWQGTEPNKLMAFILGLGMDGVPEPLMAWALGESLSGDFIGNLFKGIGAFLTGKPLGSYGSSQASAPQRQFQSSQPASQQTNRPANKPNRDERIQQLQKMYHGQDRRDEGGGKRDTFMKAPQDNHKSRFE